MQGIIAGIVLVLHIFLLGLGLLWPSKPLPRQQPRSKVVVQTVQLKPVPELSQPVAIIAPPIPEIAPPEPLSSPLVESPPLPTEIVASPAIIPSPEPIIKPTPSLSTIEQAPQVKPSPVKQEIKNPKIEKKEPAPPKPKPQTVKKPATQNKAQPATPAPKTKTAEEIQKEKKAKQEAEKARQQAQAAEELRIKQQQEKLAQARQSLAKVSDTRKQAQAATPVSTDTKDLPQLISHLQIDSLPISASPSGAVWGTKESRYQDRLIAQLESALRLPDYGTVQLKLELNREGHVVQVNIIKSENTKNQSYIERMLPTFSFAPFGKEFEGASTYTFTITLRNKIN